MTRYVQWRGLQPEMEMDKEPETGGEKEVGDRTRAEQTTNTVIAFKLSLLTEHALKG